MAYSGNFWLSLEQMEVNVSEFYQLMKSRHPDWEEKPIAGMLGNIQTESTVNPGIWQNLDEGNLDLGYGLVQWTPASKYLDWCTANNYQPGTLVTSLLRIEWEIENHQQWIPTSYYNHSFTYFLTDTNLTPYQAALVFVRNYERPDKYNDDLRGTRANYWYEYITGEIPPGPGIHGTPLPIWMMFNVIQGI